MISYLQRLQMQRGANAQKLGGAAQVDGAKKGGGAKPGGIDPDAPRQGGVHPAPKKDRGLSAAHLRQTIGDLFQRGANVGLPPSFVAKHARALEHEGPALEKLAAAIKGAAAKLDEPAKSTLQGLFARIAVAASEELGRLDTTGASAALHELITGLTAVIGANGFEPSPEQARAIEELAGPLSTIHTAGMGAVIVRATERIAASDPERAAGFSALGTSIDVVLAAAAEGGKELIANAAIDAAAGLKIGKDEGLTAGQKKILADVTRDADKILDFEAKAARKAEATIARATAAVKPALAKVPGLEGLLERAKAELPLGAHAEWLGGIQDNADKPKDQLFAFAAVSLAVYARTDALPEAAQRALLASSVALGKVPGLSADVVSAFAFSPVAQAVPEKVPGLVKVMSRLLTELAENNPNALKDATFVARLGDGLSGRTDSFAKDEGPFELLSEALSGAKNEAARRAIASFAPRFAEAAKKAEAGTTHDELAEKFAADCASLAAHGVEPTALAAAHPAIPEDSLLRLAAIGISARRDLDKWFTTLSILFEQTRGNKEHIRSLRSLFVLADQAGASATKLADALIGAEMKAPILMRTANAILDRDSRKLKKANVEKAIEGLEKGQDVAGTIESAMRRAMMKELELDQLMVGGNVKVTDAGFKAVSGPLSDLFSQGVNDGDVPKDYLQKVLIAALEDRIQDFRFETKGAAKQLGVLNERQKHLWQDTQTMTHVRLEANGRKELDGRVTSAAKLGKALEARMTEAWGKLDALQAEHEARVTELRDLPKGKVAERRKLIADIAGLPSRIRALEWANKLAKLTPETTTPLRFASMADELPKLGRILGPGMRPLIEELLWTIRIDDLRYSEVVTTDGPDLATMYDLASTNCLGGDLPSILAYATDPNKRMIVTKNQAGEQRRAVMRLVERKDKGHAGEPMLVLERTYPDSASEEEKQRIVEHVLRRATDMGVAAAYPLEYYWEIGKTNRFGGRRDLHDTKKVIEDLNRRYGTTAKNETIKVLSRATNMEHEYIDSAPIAGAEDAGNMQQRLYDRADVTYENKFMILEPEVRK